MAWQPQQGPLNQLAQCLRDSLSGHDIQAQKNAAQVREKEISMSLGSSADSRSDAPAGQNIA